jgi:hypothetical protein
MKTASFREVRTYLDTPLTAHFVKQAAANLRWKIVESDEHSLTLRTPLSFWSFGERIEVSLGRINEKALVDVTSTSIYKTQLADWGKNQRNVGRLFLEIDALLGPQASSALCPMCSHCGYLLAGISSRVCPECGVAASSGPPRSQEAATVRSFLAFGLLITSIELAICFLVGLVDRHRLIAGMPHGLSGAAYLLKVNAIALTAIFVLHHMVRWRMRRSVDA